MHTVNLVPRAFYHGEIEPGLGLSRDTLNFGVFNMIIYFGKINYVKFAVLRFSAYLIVKYITR